MDAALEEQDRIQTALHRSKRRPPSSVHQRDNRARKKVTEESDFEDLFGPDSSSDSSEAPCQPPNPARTSRQGSVEYAAISADAEEKERRGRAIQRARERRRARRRPQPEETSDSEEEVAPPRELAARLARQLVEANQDADQKQPDPSVVDDVPVWKPVPLYRVNLMRDPADMEPAPPLSCARCDFRTTNPKGKAARAMTQMDDLVRANLGVIPDHKIWDDIQRVYNLSCREAHGGVSWSQAAIRKHYTEHNVTPLMTSWMQLQELRKMKQLLVNTGVRMRDANGKNADRAATTGITAILRVQAQESKVLKEFIKLKDL